MRNPVKNHFIDEGISLFVAVTTFLSFTTHRENHLTCEFQLWCALFCHLKVSVLRRFHFHRKRFLKFVQNALSDDIP